MSRSSSSETAGAGSLVHRLADHERSFWIAAIVWYGIGDTVTTLLGLSYADVAEVGPVAGPAMEGLGAVGLILIKLGLFALAAAGWSLLRRPTRVAIPVAITIVGTAVTVWNVFVILLSTT